MSLEKKSAGEIHIISAGTLLEYSSEVLHRCSRKTIEDISRPECFKFVLITDCRRPTDLEFFRQNYKCRLIRVYCEEEVRIQRGFVFTAGIDDQETECALDSFDSWDKKIQNNGDLEDLDKQLDDLLKEFL